MPKGSRLDIGDSIDGHEYFAAAPSFWIWWRSSGNLSSRCNALRTVRQGEGTGPHMITIEQALALFAVMPTADKNAIIRGYRPGELKEYVSLDCECKSCKSYRHRFIMAVSAKADEIERKMLASQPAKGTA